MILKLVESQENKIKVFENQFQLKIIIPRCFRNESICGALILVVKRRGETRRGEGAKPEITKSVNVRNLFYRMILKSIVSQLFLSHIAYGNKSNNDKGQC